MAVQQTRVFSIKIDGVETVINSLEDAKKAIELLRQKELELEKQLANTDLSNEEVNALAKSIQNTKNEIALLTAQVNKGGFDTLANDFETVNNEVAISSDEFSELNKDVAQTVVTMNSLEELLGELEEQSKSLDIGSQEFKDTRVQVEGLKKQLQFLEVSSEAVALGFKGIGEAGNTVEGLSVQIQALNAKLSTLSDPLERAEVDKQIEQIKVAIIEAEAEAKRGIFPEGSIGRLESELESLQVRIKSVPQGSVEFNKLKKQLDETRIKADFLSQSAIEQKQLFKDLGTSIASSFGTGAGLLASFGGESEDAQKSLLILQQTLAVVDFIQQTSETLRLARQAKAVAGLAVQTAATEANTAATVQNAVAQTTLGKAVEGGGKSAKSAGGFFTTLNAIIRANPIGAIITALGILGTVIFALSSKFKFFGTIVTTVQDAFGGLVQIGKDVINGSEAIVQSFTNIGTAILDLLNPLSQAKRALNLFGGNFKVDSITDNFKKIGKAGEDLGEGLTKSFEKGVKRTQQLRALDAKEALNSATDINAQLEEAALGSSRSTSDARRAIRTRELKEDRALALERLKLENDLTDAEVAILQSGNAEKIASLKKVTNARGEVNKEILELVGKVTESDKALTEERQAAFQEYIQDRIKAVNDALAFELAKLGELNNFEKQRVALAKQTQSELQNLELQRQAGEFKTVAEYQQLKDTIIQNGANQSKAIAKEEANFRRELNDLSIDNEIANIETVLEKRRSLNDTTFEEEVNIIDRIAQLRNEKLNAEVALIDPKTTEGEKRLTEIANERLQIEREVTKEKSERQVALIENELALNQRLLDIQQKALDNAILLREGKDNKAAFEAEKLNAAIEKQRSLTFTLSEQKKLLASEQEKINIDEQKALLIAEQNLEIQRQQIALETESIALENESNQKLFEAGELTQKELDLRNQINKSKLEGLDIRDQNAVIQFEIDTEKAKTDAAKAGADATKSFQDGIIDGLGQNQIDLQLTAFLKSAFGDKAGGKLAELGKQLISQFGELGKALLDSTLAEIDNQIAVLQDKAAAIDTVIAEIDAGIAETQDNVNTLRGELADARGADRLAVNAQIDSQIEKNNVLSKQRASQEQQKQNFINQEIALEKKKRQLERDAAIANKAIALSEAIINTALGVTAAAGVAPPLGLILAAAVGALGAVQIATIAAQPIPQAATGKYINPDGSVSDVVTAGNGKMLHGNSHAKGGIMVNAEGGEAIISKRVVAKNPTLINNMIAAGQPSVIVPKFATGGLIPSPSNTTLNNIGNVGDLGLLEAIKGLQINATVAVTDVNDAQRRVKVIDSSGL
jgi:hypothetical protein